MSDCHGTPLTDARIKVLLEESTYGPEGGYGWLLRFARAIEVEHGIVAKDSPCSKK